VNDPLDRRVADALHTEANMAPDPGAAHARFLARRRQRYQRVVAATAVAAVVALAAGVLALTRHNEHNQTIAATAHTTAPQRVGAGPSPAAGDSDATTSSNPPGVTTSTIAASGHASGPPVTAKPVPASPTTSEVPHSPPTTAVSTPPGGHQTVTVSEADNGRSYTMHPGDTLYVGLAGGTGFYWSKPQSSDESVLQPTGPAYMPTANGGNAAAFLANADGHADVTSTGDPPCRQANPPCMAPSKSFVVYVTVVG
jgi:hypothetical protein